MTTLPHLIACATCQGNPGAPSTNAANWAVIFMLGMLVLMFSGIGALAISFARRQKKLAAAAAAETPASAALS